MNTTVTAHNATEIASTINARFAAGTAFEVNGETLVSRFGSPVARAWQNGTVSFTVKGRTKGKVRDLFVKVGRPLTVA